MPSEVSRKKALEIVGASVLEHDEDCGRLATPTYSGQCDCGFEVLADEIAAALDEARAEGEKRGAERERWECFMIACIRPMECGGEEGDRREESNWSDRLKHHRHYDCLEALSIAEEISGRGPARLSARGPMRGPEEDK